MNERSLYEKKIRATLVALLMVLSVYGESMVV